MRRKLLIAFGVILCVASHAQVQFEKGYFIDDAGNTVTCLIKNHDWKNNPTSFEYRLSETAETLKSSLQEVQEFGVGNSLKYKRFVVEIDRSSSRTAALSNKRAPEFKEETQFLKVLVEGKASLYQFNDDVISRFFYSMDEANPQQLVYKEYRTKDTRAINDSYKQQLLNDFKCTGLTEADARGTTYSASGLIRYFKKYNECEQSSVKVFAENSDRLIFNLSLRPGVVFSSLSMANELTGAEKLEFGNNISFRLGFETELVFPFNNNKWSLVIEPTYQQFKSELQSETNSGHINYKSIEFPFGVRRYFFVSPNSKLFINAQYLLDVPLESSVQFSSGVMELKPKHNGSVVAGIGLNIKSRFSLEARYQANRQLFNGFTFIDTKYHGIAMILGYTF